MALYGILSWHRKFNVATKRIYTVEFEILEGAEMKISILDVEQSPVDPSRQF